MKKQRKTTKGTMTAVIQGMHREKNYPEIEKVLGYEGTGAMTWIQQKISLNYPPLIGRLSQSGHGIN